MKLKNCLKFIVFLTMIYQQNDFHLYLTKIVKIVNIQFSILRRNIWLAEDLQTKILLFYSNYFDYLDQVAMALTNQSQPEIIFTISIILKYYLDFQLLLNIFYTQKLAFLEISQQQSLLFCKKLLRSEMSRCQHNQKITKFCITPSCNHLLSGGCQYCFKRYHCHIGEVKFLKESEANEMIKYLTSFQDKKTKVRPLKEAIYNYFNIIKGQLSTYLDCISSDLLNKISYPYIIKEGNLNILKKLKHKQYNKITPEQMMRMSDFKDKNDPEKLQKNQILSYIEQSSSVFKKISNINTLYKQFEKESEQSYMGEAIMSVSIFYKKIIEIQEHIENQKSSLIKRFSEDWGKNSPQISTKAQVFPIKESKQKKQKATEANTIEAKLSSSNTKQTILNQSKKQSRSRKVSIDSRCNEFLVKSRLKTYQQKQKEIQERKQQLVEMMSKSQKKQSTFENSRQSQNEIPRKKQQNYSSSAVNQNISESNVKRQSFQEDNIPHTLLPEGKQEKKLYEQNQTIEKKTMKIPVNVIQQNVEDQQCQSPILKLKKSEKHRLATGNSGFQLGLYKVQQSQKGQQTRSEPIQQATQSESKSSSEASDKQNMKPLPGEHHQVSITQKQANSLFLLIQSLKMSAKKAIPILEAALKYAPNNFSAAQYLSYLYLQQNKPKQCLKICNDTLKQISGEPNSNQISFHLFNNKAAALNVLGRFSESIPILQKCIQTKKKDILYKNLGDAYFNLGIVQKAIMNYQNCLILNSDNHEALYNLGVCLYLQKNYDSSKLKIQRALMLDHQNQSYIQFYKQITSIMDKK